MSGASQVPVYLPLSFSQILSRIYRVIQAHLRTQLEISVLPAMAFFIGYGILLAIMASTFVPTVLKGKEPQAPQVFTVMFAGSIALMIVYLITLGLFQAAASYAAVNADCGVHVTVKEAYRIAQNRAGHFIGLMLSIYVVSFGPMLLIEAGTFGAMAALAANKVFAPVLMVAVPIGMLLLFAAMIGGVIVALRLSLAFPASVFEGLDVRESIKRSWVLTRGAAGRIFLVILVIYAAMYLAMLIVIIVMMIVALIGYLALSSAFAHPTTHTIVILVICGAAIYIALMSAFGACFWTGIAASLSVIYNDQRLRMTPPPQNVTSAGAPA